MALQPLYRITFNNSENSGYVSGDKVITYWDDVAQSIVAKKNGTTITSGSNLLLAQTRPPRGSVTTNYVVTNEPIDSPSYQFCSGNTLSTFQFQTIFPYSKKTEIPNSASCVTGIVCDLEFLGAPVVTPPTSETATDGQFSVTAVGSNGTTKYALEDLLYSQMTNTTGTFTGLGEGAYVVYARDSYNCSKTISVLVEATDKYGTLYQCAYQDLSGLGSLIEIQQAKYVGVLSQVTGADSPLTLSLRGENQGLFTTTFATNAFIGLTSKTNFQFLPLFTQSDREYLVKFFKNQPQKTTFQTAQVTALSQIVNGGAAAWGSPYCIITLGGGTTITGYTKLLPVNQSKPITIRVFWEHDVTVGTITASSFDVIMLRHDFSVIGTPTTVDTGTGTTSGSPTLTFDPLGNTIAYIGFQPKATSTFSAVSRLLLDSLELTVSFVEKWRGFIKPSLYTEQYVTDANYYVTAEATDQLENLKDIQFLDKNGNKISGELSLIKIIAIILSFTDLDLGIKSYANVFEVNMTTNPQDDPLSQTYIDSSAYFDSDNALSCAEVLNNILLSFGCRILQWEGYWHIMPVDGYSSSMAYREFDSFGNYVSNGTFDASLSINAKEKETSAFWANRNQTLEIRSAYGKSAVTINLKKVDFGIKNGGFESFSTALEFPNGTNGLTPRGGPKTRITGYDNWTLNLNGNVASLPFTFNAFPNKAADRTINKDQANRYSGAILSNSNNTTYASDAYLQSTPQDIVFGESDWIRLSFDFLAANINNPLITESKMEPPFVKFRFSFKLENYYLRADGGWTTDSNFQWIEVNVDRGSYGSWKTIEAKAQCPPVTGSVATTYTVKLMHGSSAGNTWDFTSSGDLQNLATVNLQVGAIAFVAVPDAIGTIYRWYRLEASTQTTSDPARLRPNDYNGTTNKVVWIKFEEYSTFNVGQKSIRVRNFDNVTVEVLPQGEVSPTERVEEEINDSKIKDAYEVTLINGDAPFDISNAKNIYYNYYRFSDGTPTISWNRAGVNEDYSILGLLAKRVIEQNNKPLFKLTGDMGSGLFFGFNIFFNDVYTGKKYLPMAISLNDKDRIIGTELQEVLELTATGAEDVGEFDSSEFDNSFDI